MSGINRNPLFHTWRSGLAALGAALLLTGCGVDSSPVASTDDRKVRAPAAKKGGKKGASVNETSTTTNSVSGDFCEAGGHITIKAGDTVEWIDGELKIKLSVDKSALHKRETIDMVIHGSRASDLVIDFGPDGLVFRHPAVLKLTLGPSLIDIPLSQIAPWHEHDGVVDQQGIVEMEWGKDGSLNLKIEVPGFSRYGLRSR